MNTETHLGLVSPVCGQRSPTVAQAEYLKCLANGWCVSGHRRDVRRRCDLYGWSTGGPGSLELEGITEDGLIALGRS